MVKIIYFLLSQATTTGPPNPPPALLTPPAPLRSSSRGPTPAPRESAGEIGQKNRQFILKRIFFIKSTVFFKKKSGFYFEGQDESKGPCLNVYNKFN